MKEKVSYYVSRKNPFTWLSCAAFLCSAAVRIWYAAVENVTPHLWLVTLPVLACVLISATMLINGQELLYRTAVPFNMGVLYFVIRVCLSNYTPKIKFLYVFAYAVIGIFYAEILSGNFGRRLIIGLALLGAFILEFMGFLRQFPEKAAILTHPVIDGLPDMLLLLGAFFLICAMAIHLDGAFHPSWGDRSDGRRVRHVGIVTQASAFIMKTREDASNHIHDRVEVSEIDRFIQSQKEQGYKNMGFMHVFLAAYVRAVAKYPAINRFLSGQRLYSRGHDIQFCMVVKNSMSLEGEESVLKLHLSPYDTIYDIYEKLDKEVERIKKTPVGSSDFDKVARLFSLIPRFIVRFGVWLIEQLDYYGMIPKFLLEISPFHSSIFFTSMASLGINPIVHHLYNFGNMPVFCSFGTKYNENETDRDGNLIRRRYIDYTFNTDERIVDGFYYASVFKYIKKMLNHPEKLTQPPAEVLEDVR